MTVTLHSSYMPPAEESGTVQSRVLLAGYGRGDRALAAALEERGVTAWVVDDLSAAREEARRLHPDVVLVGSGGDLAERTRFISEMRGDGSTDCLLYLASRADPVETSEALAAGAHDIVLRPHSAAAVMVRIELQKTRAKAAAIPGPFMSWGKLTLDLSTREVLVDDRPVSLTGREFELLLRLLESGGRVVTREALITGIWGSEQYNVGVLEANVHRLRRKLSAMLPNQELLETVRGVGYRLAQQPAKDSRPTAG
jgi:DNA-binding response OmpR family regulator